MILHVLQHVWFEDLGIIQDWAVENGFTITRTALFDDDPLPKIDDFDWLVVMGGPMNIYEEDKYPWLKNEKVLILQAIEANKKVLGICLGAQLIADALGSKVYKGKHKEIGWFPINFKNTQQSLVLKNLPEKFTVFHWHQDTFDIPKDAIHFAESEACMSQGFVYNNCRVVALQFHSELEEEGVWRLLDECSDELVDGQYIQSEEEIVLANHLCLSNHELMRNLLLFLKNV